MVNYKLKSLDFIGLPGFVLSNCKDAEIYLIIGVWQHRLLGIISEMELVTNGTSEPNILGASSIELEEVAGAQMHSLTLQIFGGFFF